ncbi:DivIVA domain-containing protein [Actinotalea caeni]|uniref:DivIVA domain-containing protein n=1 Tax=Actinotalea caeni TaxID=1348467 RepID=UPI0012E267D8|nr:DivIVA domain-containing protein [Actinotalea caeni]
MADTFPRTGRWSSGYDVEQVDEFFEQARAAYEDDGASGTTMTAEDVRNAAFDLVRGGYDPAHVDAALDRLEAAFVQRARARHIGQAGQDAWMEEVARRATTLYPRLVRPAGERFAPPERGRGYDRESVDALLDRLVDYFDSGAELSAAEVRSATFKSAPRDRAYAEGPVDAFLDRAVDVLLAVE